MIIKVHRRNNPFAQIDKGILRDKRLSFKARGIAAYLFTHGEDWQVRLSDLTDNSTDGAKAVRNGLKELKALGYARLVAIRNEDNLFVGKTWEVSEMPIWEEIPDMTLLATSTKSERPKRVMYKNKEVPKGTNVELVKEVVSFLNAKTGSKYRHTTKQTQKHINARIKEGYTVEDFKLVINDRVRRWSSDPKMREYLRPQTLFAGKFESYLNAVELDGHRRKQMEQSAGATEYDDAYQNYLTWAADNCPDIVDDAMHLSKSEYISFKQRNYTRSLSKVGEDIERKYFFRAHNVLETDAAKRKKFNSVWSYFLHTMHDLVKFSTTV